MPTDDDLPALLAVIDRGIHDSTTMPFKNAWTDLPKGPRDHSSLQWWWSKRAQWTSREWTFCGAVFVDGAPVGSQDVMASNFSDLKVVKTGSWLGKSSQGQGLGKEMRAAILHFAFDGLGATHATSSAFRDNHASIATSRSLGYRDNGERVALRRGVPTPMVQFVLDAETWRQSRRDDIEVSGLDACRDFFGA